MTNRLHPKVRFVKCPRCATILQEPEQVPLYTCGGCGTTLQAKYYNWDNGATELGLLQQGVVQSNDVVHVPDSGESGDSSQRSSSSCEQSTDQNGRMNVNDVENRKSDQIEAPKSSATEQSTGQNGWRDQNSVEDCKSEQIESPNSAHHTSSSENSDFPDNQGIGVIDNKTNQFDSIDIENRESEQFTVENPVLEKKESSKFVPDHTVLENTELQHSAVNGAVENEDQHEQSCDTAFDNQKQVREASDNGTVHDGRDYHTLGGDTGNEHLGKDHDDLAECIGEKLESLNLSEARLSTAADLRTAGEMGSCDVSREPQRERNSIDEHEETCGQRINNSDDCAVDRPEQVSLTNTHEEVGSSVQVVPRSLTKGSPAYDGSVSSLDGNDDQVIEQQDHFPDETLPGNGEVAESHEWSNVPPNRPYRSSRNNQNHARNSSQVILDEKLKSSMLEEENLNAIPGKHRITQSRERFPPRAPFYRSSELAYETGSSSSYIHDEVSSHHPYRYDRRRFPEASGMENEFLPMYYNSYETSGEFYHRSGNYGYFDRRRRAESWSQSGSLPPMPYLSEVCYGRHQMQDPYMHHHHHRPDAPRWSTQLPPRVCRQGLCAGPSRVIRWDPYDTYPTSPPSFMESDSYPWAHDTNSFYDDQRYKDQVMRRLYRREKEKQHAVKRHLLPLAGGAPFVTCYFCFRVLQLPQDSFLSRRTRTHHRVKCGYCSKILEFSRENESCLAPFMPNPIANADAEANTGKNIDSRESFLEDSRKSRNRERQSQSHDAKASSVLEARQVKVTWQLPARSKSPLHRLMGYSSPHDLLNGDAIEDLDS